MSPTGLETVEETERREQLEEPESARATPRRLLRAVEQYRAACAARGVPPGEEESWLVLLAALAAERDSGDA